MNVIDAVAVHFAEKTGKKEMALAFAQDLQAMHLLVGSEEPQFQQAQPGSNRYFITISEEDQKALLLYAQRNHLLMASRPLTEPERQAVVHETLKMVIKNQASIERAAVEPEITRRVPRMEE